MGNGGCDSAVFSGFVQAGGAGWSHHTYPGPLCFVNLLVVLLSPVFSGDWQQQLLSLRLLLTGNTFRQQIIELPGVVCKTRGELPVVHSRTLERCLLLLYPPHTVPTSFTSA